MDGVPGPHPGKVVRDCLGGAVARKRRDERGEQDSAGWCGLGFGNALLVAEDVEDEEPGPIGFPSGVGEGVFQHIPDSGQVRG